MVDLLIMCVVGFALMFGAGAMTCQPDSRMRKRTIISGITTIIVMLFIIFCSC